MNTKPMSFQEAFAAIVDPDAMIWSFDKAMYRHWKTNNAGNTKARRRWRRRDIPNNQRSGVIATQHQRIDTLAGQIEAQR